MGVRVCQSIVDDPELNLVAAVDPVKVSQPVELVNADHDSLVYSDSLQSLSENDCDVAVDFTHLDIAKANAEYCAQNKIHMVIGTSGFDESEISLLKNQFTESNCVVVPNFSISAVLLKRLAISAAPYFDTVEVIEYHHNQKKDAPSGTAIDLVEGIANAKSDWEEDPTTVENIESSRGAKGSGDIPIHAVRMKGMMGHQEVIFGSEGQILTLRQDSFDRSSFMPGVILAVKKIVNTPGVSVGLDSFL